uniref:Xrn1 N-terminal domain-containing protein n=1 Tax=Aegilops tauschii subsp. strangulata TaxID=200361 RepID=A0A453HN74_AEGTS
GPCTISRVLGRSGLVSHLRLLRTHAGVPSSGDVRRGVPVHVRLHGPPAPHVRPRRLLYLAVDGVAPRAKMNQQRARRFKSAKAAKEAELEESIMRERFRAQGKEVLPRDDAPREVSDPNIITPGTEFMEKLSAALEYYVRARLSSHPRWKDVKVILSDANVPGEGEHKIMSFIRAQRSMESYDPNTRHCLYGLDADLIMLALASHKVHFSILREDVLRQNHQPDICVPVTDKSFTAQELPKVKCRGWFPRITEARSKGKLPKKPYQFLNIWVLREYLELEMTIPGCKHDIDRLIDDFIFICFLTGNDFIPHIPSLEIHEYAVDLLIDVYKTMYKKMGGYIVDTDKIKDKHAAYVKISRLEKFLHELSLHEEKIFLKRYELREKLLRKIQRQAAEDEWNERNYEIVVRISYSRWNVHAQRSNWLFCAGRECRLLRIP